MPPEASIVASTLIEAIALVGGLSCLGWILLGVPGKLPFSISLRFALANLLLVVGLGLVLGRNRSLTPLVFWLNYGLGDVLLVAAVAFFSDGTSRLQAVEPRRVETVAVVVAFAVAIALIPYPDVTIRSRGILFSVAMAWLAARMVHDCLRGGRHLRAGLPQRIAAAVFGLLGLVLGVRAVALVFWPEQATTLESTSVSASVPFLWASTAVLLAINHALAGLVVSGLVQHINRLATHDTLTGCLNRRAVDDCLRRQEAGMARDGKPFGLIMLDIDHFKRVNDRFGHLAGDAVLRFVADLIRGHLRVGDEIARWGGEEFLVVLPGTDHAAALAIARRMQETLAATPWLWQGSSVQLTASFSATAVRQDKANLQALDRGLYRAKDMGRNRVEAVLPA